MFYWGFPDKSACNAGDPSSIPGLGRSSGEGGVWGLYSLIFIPAPSSQGEEGFLSLFSLPGGSEGVESACNAGDLGLIPGLGRSRGEGKGYLFQYSGLENPMDCIVYEVAKSQIQLSDFHISHLGQSCTI